MIILTVRTDKPEAELALYKDSEQIAEHTWQAHRALAETINLQIKSLLDEAQLKYEDLNGVLLYSGPGSFTGLRIGASVAAALAHGLQIPIVGEAGESWLEVGLPKIVTAAVGAPISLEYGAPVHITAPRK